MVLKREGYNFDQLKSAGLHEKHVHTSKLGSIHVLFSSF
jgi:hypothetical protein